MVSFLTGFAKGVFDGINEDAAAQRQFDYDSRITRMKEDAKKVDRTQLIANVDGIDLTYELPDEDITGKDNITYHNQALRNYIDSTNKKQFIMKDGSMSGVYQYLQEKGDYKTMQKIYDNVSLHSSFITRPKIVDGIPVVTELNIRPTDGPAWYDIFKKQAERNSGQGIVENDEELSKFVNSPEGTIIFGTLTGEKGSQSKTPFLLRNRDIEVVEGLKTDGTLKKRSTTNEDIVKFFRRKGNQLNIKASSQEDLREQVLDYYTGSDLKYKGKDEFGFDIKKTYSISDQIRLEIGLANLIPNGYKSISNPNVIAAVNTFIKEEVPDEVSKNPKQLLSLVSGLFQDQRTLTDVRVGDPSDDFNKFLEILGYKDTEALKKDISDINKPLKRVQDIQTAFDSGAIQELIGGAAQTTLFINGVKSQAKLFGQRFGNILGINEDTVRGRLDSIRNNPNAATKPNEVDLINQNIDQLTEDIRITNDRLATATEEDRQKFQVEQTIAVVRYQTFLLAFEMAAAVQGGGDSRTISNKDVELMQKALTISFFTSPKNFRAILSEIEKDLEQTKGIREYWKDAIDSTSLRVLKGANFLEKTKYNITNRIENTFQSLAQKYYDTATAANDDTKGIKPEELLKQNSMNVDTSFVKTNIEEGGLFSRDISEEEVSEMLARPITSTIVGYTQFKNYGELFGGIVQGIAEAMKGEYSKKKKEAATGVFYEIGVKGKLDDNDVNEFEGWEDIADGLGLNNIDQLSVFFKDAEIRQAYLDYLSEIRQEQ